MKTVLVTGCSSGFGLDAARTFAARDFRVIATMRNPRADLLPAAQHVRVLPLDVTDAGSIARLVEAAGPIDALVNNAGVGLASVLEGTPMSAVRGIFETNTFGPIALTQAFLPSFRERRGGVIVNVTSSVTLRPLPMLATYTASKAALNAFTESLALELAPFGVRACLVVPGQAPETSFGQNARARIQADGVQVPSAYAEFASQVFSRMMRADGGPARPFTRSSEVTDAIWRAVTDPTCPIFQPAGADAVALAPPR
jgi:NAD(P)-dependent dehydrogenase (short-subunit alcohol dehydrogenase family)